LKNRLLPPFPAQNPEHNRNPAATNVRILVARIHALSQFFFEVASRLFAEQATDLTRLWLWLVSE
jgi:hypothetical protein